MILEGIGGLHYSTTDDSFTFSENLPKEWSFMEFQVPVQKPNEGKVIFISVLSRQQNDSPEKVFHEKLNFLPLIQLNYLGDGKIL